MAGPYIANSWVTGQFITQVKMMQHVTNEEYLRERTDFISVPIPNFMFKRKTSHGLEDLKDSTVTFFIDGLEVASVLIVGSVGEFSFPNIDISGSSGLSTFNLSVNVYSQNHTSTPGRFYVGNDINKLSVWGRLYGERELDFSALDLDVYRYEVVDITAIMTRQAMY